MAGVMKCSGKTVEGIRLLHSLWSLTAPCFFISQVFGYRYFVQTATSKGFDESSA